MLSQSIEFHLIDNVPLSDRVLCPDVKIFKIDLIDICDMFDLAILIYLFLKNAYNVCQVLITMWVFNSDHT